MRRLLALCAIACNEPTKLDSVIHDPPQSRIALDGELTERAWRAHAIHGAFDGGGEVHLLRDETHLFIGLVGAATADITGGTFVGHVDGERGTPATMRVARGHDLELALPLAALGRPPIALEISRCDATRTCTAWQTQLDPKALFLVR